ncbi:glycosyl transferase family 4 [Planomicrobium soli]|uniref:Glycosyl transferase family 4 n=1 Tax=Planomicrobium soli TaxID=1176648 RepID=A0A2P8H3J4_9BACL|nr:glycosyltransferase family 4 protein [Planomicrobium soli]PSL40794.1 glycosyl transferase family 4 [Planomicrobium soli]
MGTKVMHAVTSSGSLGLLRGQMAFLKQQGYEVRMLCSAGGNVEKFEKREGVKVSVVNIEREISLLKDLKSLIACIRVIQQEKPDIVSAGTPKAGLVVMLASFLCGVPIRIYNVLGLRLETTRGLKKLILLMAEKIAATAATNLLAVSPSLKDQLINLGIANEEKIRILGQGSFNGFDIESFRLTEELRAEVEAKKAEHGVTDKHTVLGYVGRITKDKGIEEMVESFLTLNKIHPNLRLMIVGDYEEGDPVSNATRLTIEKNENIIHAHYQEDPVPYYYLMNIFVFLTKREGFGNVSVEAALAGMPVIAADVTGARDTIVNGETGFLVDPTDPKEVANKLDLLITDLDLREHLAANGKKRAEENFANETVWQEMNVFYHELLAEKLEVAREVQ